MKVVVYLEGPSDVFSMKALLRPLLDEKARQGVQVFLLPSGKGDAKSYLLDRVPLLAASELSQKETDTTIVVMPDLYPPGKSDFKDDQPEDLKAGILAKFRKAAKAKGVRTVAEMEARLQVFCFKHDLEVLLLAVPEHLGKHLGLSSLKPTWKRPVEDQNHSRPPKRVVEKLFREHHRSYDPKVDAPRILSQVSYQEVAKACPQCFAPFVEFLETCGRA